MIIIDLCPICDFQSSLVEDNDATDVVSFPPPNNETSAAVTDEGLLINNSLLVKNLLTKDFIYKL